MAIIDLSSSRLSYHDSLSHALMKSGNPITLTPATVSTNAITTVETVVSTTITYLKRGYRVSTNQYEYWQTTDRDGSPPSGNPLIDITVLGSVTT